MTGKFWIRAVGVLTCMVAVGTGWDAEAARRHCNRRASCCYEPVCCAPVCCEPVCVSYVTSTPACCVADTCCNVVYETVVIPSRPCCDVTSTDTAKQSGGQTASATTAPARSAAGTKASATSLKR